MKEQFPLPAEQWSFDECVEVDTVRFSQQIRTVKWIINSDTKFCAYCLWSREKTTTFNNHWYLSGIWYGQWQEFRMH